MLKPEILVNTPRLQMREFCAQDAEEVLEFSSDESMLKFIPGDHKVKSKKEALFVIENIWLKEYEQYGYARYALIHKDDNKIIGFCGFKYEPANN
ncbi:GNAT family N-acetyltransferase [Aliikangiella marina]|uniref:GNAT family N-acetyltransferase n=1 Tax=Aliikangiella marina TaxID=1712262 RepID=A0A545TJ12_9GAMM|nr:GNAT family N-acetyltransferase [Aliikangiella marina]TQV77187.1 GNAT family N-acetyltransferase [Aliikangiella marina]